MKKFIVLITMLFGCQILNAQDYQKAIDKARFLISQHQKQTNIPGIQVALMLGDSLIWSEAFGYSNLNGEVPINPTTKFRIASVSKSVTSVALGKMIEQKEIDIDKDINIYLPEFPKKSHPITSRQLAASTSGIRHYTNSDPRYNSTNYSSIISSLERFKDDPLLFEPGTAFHYSSYGWVLLSAVMEKAYNKPFVQIMEESWNNLGMAHTSFDFPDKEIPDKSIQYVAGKKEERIEAPFDNRSYMYAGGGYLSTAEDLVLMGSQLLNEKYISKETLDILFSSYYLIDDTKTNYGLGWECGVNRMNTSVVYHSGSMSSARSHLVIFPEEKIVFAYLANTGDNIFFNEREAHSIAELFLEEPSSEEVANKIIGEWKIITTSLKDKKTSGVLRLSKNMQGVIEGSITFKRSKQEKTFPVVLTGVQQNQFHLMAVTPMFLDIFLTVNGDEGNGIWLHDFNVNGTPETDNYWKPRIVTAKRKTFSNNK
jgi:CubicO group peptidase (beta-lactamase class C family)